MKREQISPGFPSFNARARTNCGRVRRLHKPQCAKPKSSRDSDGIALLVNKDKPIEIIFMVLNKASRTPSTYNAVLV
jgi:hypothetical protein